MAHLLPHLASCLLALVVAPAPGQDAVKAELAKLQGTWELVGMEVNGQKWPAAKVKSLRQAARVEGDKVTLTRPDQTTICTVQLDPTAKPKTIDLAHAHADPNGERLSFLGIYTLDGDTFTVCYAAAGHPRPPRLGSTADGLRSVQVFQRRKK